MTDTSAGQKEKNRNDARDWSRTRRKTSSALVRISRGKKWIETLHRYTTMPNRCCINIRRNVSLTQAALQRKCHAQGPVWGWRGSRHFKRWKTQALASSVDGIHYEVRTIATDRRRCVIGHIVATGVPVNELRSRVFERILKRTRRRTTAVTLVITAP